MLINPAQIEIPMPISTPRLLLRSKQPGDGAATAVAVAETWTELHQWMQWAENLEDLTAERIEARHRRVAASFIRRELIELIGIEIATGQPVIWTGFHDINWETRECDTGFWVRKSAHNRGFATESTNALLRYAFEALGMRRVGITHSSGNEASRRVAQKLNFTPEGIIPAANLLPEGKVADRHCYSRFHATGLPPLQVKWGVQD